MSSSKPSPEKKGEVDQFERVESHTSFVPPPITPWQRRLIVLSLGLSLFLGALDITIIATALPNIAEHFKVSSREYAWIGSGYTLSTTASTPVWVKLSDIIGRKPTIMSAVTIFMVGSLVCALANSSAQLLGGRVTQGLGGGGSIVMVTVIVGDIFALADRAKYYAIIGSAFALASAIGPVLGGALTESVSWRWCFYINLPFDGIVLILLFFNLNVKFERQESLIEGLVRIDFLGFLLIIGGTICFLYGLEAGSSGLLEWKSGPVICMIIFGFLVLALFMAWEATYAKDPLIPLRIFQKKTALASFTVACLHSFVFISYDFFLPLYYQIVLGFKPLASGLMMFALIIPMTIVTFSGGLIIKKTGNYLYLMFAGTILLTLGTGLFITFDTKVSWVKIIMFQIVAGIGAGPLFQSPLISLQSHITQNDTAAAMSALTFLRNLFTSISIVIGTVLIQQKIGKSSLTTISDDADSGNAGKQQYIKGLRIMWIFYTCIAAVTILATCFIKSTPMQKKTVQDATPKSDSTDTAI